MSENRLLVWEAMKKKTGGNTHDADALISSYRNALDVAMDGRCVGKRKKEAIQVVMQAESALRLFVYPEAE